MTSDYFNRVLRDNVVEIKFIKKNGQPRKMLCTKSRLLLQSLEGSYYLKYRLAVNKLNYSPRRYNNVIVWDIQNEDYRQVNCDTVVITRKVSAEQYLKTLREHPEAGY